MPEPVLLSAQGKQPDILVDAAGTSHIVWGEENGDENPDVTRYCRLPRGATACTASASLVPPTTQGQDPRFDEDFAGPEVLTVGDTVVIIANRRSGVWAWTSEDTWDHLE